MLPSRRELSPEEAMELASERKQRDREADQYDRLLALRLLSLAEIPATLNPLEMCREDHLIEIGCGTGRITIPAARCGAAVVAMDHSLESLRVLQAKLHRVPNTRVLLVQADATALPVRPAWASCAISSQVIEHLPSDRLRRRMVAEIARTLATGGRFALSGYHDWPLLRRLLPRDGHHSNAIHFHRFAPEELRALLEPTLELDQLTSRLIYLLLAHGHKPKTPEC